MGDMFKYDVTIKPTPVGIDATVTAARQDLTVSATGPSVTLVLTPSGSFIQKVLSAVIYPIAEIIALANKNALKDALKDNPQTISTAQGYTADGFTITPSNLALGGFDAGGISLAKITGTLDLAVAPGGGSSS